MNIEYEDVEKNMTYRTLISSIIDQSNLNVCKDVSASILIEGKASAVARFPIDIYRLRVGIYRKIFSDF